MVIRNNQRNGNEARETVMDSLELSSEELGADDHSAFGADDDNDDGDLGEDDDLGQERQPQRTRSRQGDGDDDLGDDDDLGEDDLGDGLDGFFGDEEQRGQRRQRQQPRSELDDLSVSHTRGPGRARTKMDRNGNVVDIATNRIVAKRGKEARLYQDADKARRTADASERNLAEVTSRLGQAVQIGRRFETELKTLKTHQEALKQFNIEPADQLEAFRLYAALKKDTKGTLKSLLTRAAARGIVVQDAQGDGAPAFDVKSLMDAVREEMKPLRERLTADDEQRTTREQETARLNETRAEVDNFFRRTPAAVKYARTIHKIIADPRFSHMTLGEAWAEVRLHLMRKRQAGNGNGQQRGQRQRTSLRGRLPQGRGNPPPGGADNMNVNQSYDEILRDLLPAR